MKNHSFSDGNKRIAAFLFVWFLDRNRCLYHPDGSRRLAETLWWPSRCSSLKASPRTKPQWLRWW
ncbi:Fic family protein [Hymenobacter coccineus]|uniref:Fic family protein n=1 Tax=Hymenobacter coccineus TaxID=1908235 RepID=UPI001EFB205F|nr:Fic family protein [Hymenobacter coccineus]